ncbi:MAG: hypothetical protein NTX71_12095 [Candidatus Aureabacteria bacterium]|nr:hypothetical protein [Candidatus Auribacterota bacterium]
MKTFIAYALVVSGIPILAGSLFGWILTMPISLIIGLSRRGTETPLDAAQAQAGVIAWLFTEKAKMAVGDLIAHACLDVFSGFGAVLAAALLFHILGLPLGVAVLLIIAAWEMFFTVRYGQSFRALFTSLVGVAVGWFVVLWLFSF